MDLVWLGQPECSDPATVSGKAANLSRLAADHRVPPGFVVTAAAHDSAIRAGRPDRNIGFGDTCPLDALRLDGRGVLEARRPEPGRRA